jgi:hypothetical protein
VFKPSSDIKICYSEKFVLQKLEYMNANPTVGKWELVSSAVDYPHLRASYYQLNREHYWAKTSTTRNWLGITEEHHIASSRSGDDARQVKEKQKKVN